MRSRIAVVAVLLAALLSILGMATAYRFTSDPKPAFALQIERDAGCREVDTARPDGHGHWFRRPTYDESLHWSDIQIVDEQDRNRPHGMTGDVRIGQVVCGLPAAGSAIFAPEGHILYSWGA